ncbi:non-heme chloroperoxidase [Luteibacter sp. UNCMF331Sha3.1]|uniref:alpha/beta fold hydrolase n=1 Tax=Luteibacter sp. UNCMF331Sha3.1 TaxID=1502760 RepID=UPI0008B41676|nr:alpha/beta hydrolase [Luteibacter sp. UNCMF331Sha3.1]SEN11275.1 non-heme chloroperoxidase [Luteibacter sp. UNCMF331Sha3.1]
MHSNPPRLPRRQFLSEATKVSVAAAGFAAGLASGVNGTANAAPAPTGGSRHAANGNYLTVKDGTRIFYRDWGTGPVVTFSHGWPLTADAWDAQMFYLSSNGFRVIAHDRRGHGRSSQPWDGNDMDTYADDLAALLDALNVRGATLVGHSTGGGEVARYIGRHGTSRVAKAVLISAVPPHLAQSPTNPAAAPMSVFDGLRSSVIANRSQFFKDLAMPFFGYNKPDVKPSQGIIDSFWAQGMMASVKAAYDCIKAFSETDFTDDLAKMTVPTLIIQGDADQIVPFNISGERQAKILPKPTLKVYPGAPHGLCVTEADKVNADLLAFLRS